MEFQELLRQLGISLTSSGIIEFIKSRIASGITNKEILKQELVKIINIDGADIKAEKIITFLANKGHIVIKGSLVHAKEGLILGAEKGKILHASGSSFTTKNTGIHMSKNAHIISNGGVIQQGNGSISFGFYK